MADTAQDRGIKEVETTNSNIIEFVRKKYGCAVSGEFYAQIDIWKSWWKGYYQPFHDYTVFNGLKRIKRKFYTLEMGRKVCQDWASILLNEKTECIISDKSASEFVQGKRGNKGVFGDNFFWKQGNRLIEKAFATGTGAVTLRLEGAVQNGRKVSGGKIRMSYISAEHIIPISCRSGVITEAAFCSEHIIKGKRYFHLEAHVLENDCYVIRNHFFRENSAVIEEEKLPEGIVKEFNTGSAVPWFSVISPNIENIIDNNGGLGISVLHGSLDVLKGIDFAYNNFCKDFELGGKKVFMLRDLIETDVDGNPVAPDDVGQQLFTLVNRDSMETSGSSASDKFIYEFNPALRVQENIDGIQAQLDYLSFKCGLGNKHYQFNSGSVVTATQYTGDKQDLLQNAHKHYITVEPFLLSLVRSVIHIGNRYCGLNAAEDSEIEIVFDKSVVIDEASERECDRQDVRDHIMPAWEYRMKWYGETEDEAKKKLEGTEELYGEGDFE